MHPRPRTAKQARVSFDPDLDVVRESLTIEGGLTTGPQGEGWGGHWPTRVANPQPTTGKGKEAMEPPITTSKRTPQALSARLTLQPDQDTVIETTICHFCRRADLWLYFTCAVCQLITHAKCYYRLGSDETAYYETNPSAWRCQDCGGPQRHADCALSHNGHMLQRHVGPRLSNSDYPTSGDGGVAAGATVMPTRSLLARDNDPMDYDMPEDLNAAMLISPRTHPTTVTSLVPPMHDMPIDQDTKTRKGHKRTGTKKRNKPTKKPAPSDALHRSKFV
jgi:hypothetical protein